MVQSLQQYLHGPGHTTHQLMHPVGVQSRSSKQRVQRGVDVAGKQAHASVDLMALTGKAAKTSHVAELLERQPELEHCLKAYLQP